MSTLFRIMRNSLFALVLGAWSWQLNAIESLSKNQLYTLEAFHLLGFEGDIFESSEDKYSMIVLYIPKIPPKKPMPFNEVFQRFKTVAYMKSGMPARFLEPLKDASKTRNAGKLVELDEGVHAGYTSRASMYLVRGLYAANVALIGITLGLVYNGSTYPAGAALFTVIGAKFAALWTGTKYWTSKFYSVGATVERKKEILKEGRADLIVFAEPSLRHFFQCHFGKGQWQSIYRPNHKSILVQPRNKRQ